MKFYLLLILVCAGIMANAQTSQIPAKDSVCTITLTDTINVSGVILYSNNRPAVDVIIYTNLQYYGVSAITDSLGRFYLKNVKPIDTLIIESSYFSKTIPNNGSRFLRILIPTLAESAGIITTVTVEGTANAKKKFVNSKLTASCGPYFPSYGVYPEFPGGTAKLEKFIKANLVYPTKAVKDNLEGEVIVQLIIGKDGTPSDFMISSGLSNECDQAAINALKKMPKWKQAIFGRPVEYPLSIAVQFALIR